MPQQPESPVASVRRSPLLPTSRLILQPLAIHREDDEFIVGRVDAGTFAAMPEIAVHVIRLLQSGIPLEQVQARLVEEHGAEVDLEAFIDQLLELEFIQSIDGRQLEVEPVAAAHLGRIEARHVGWIFGWPGTVAFAALMAGGALALIRRPDLLPSYHDFSWTASSSVVLVGNALWLVFNQLIHELAHLFAARSLGLPARLELSTRLHFVVAQTQLSSLWSVPRRHRLGVYLAGIAWDLIPIAVGLMLSAFLPLSLPFRRFLAAVMLINWLGILWQFNVYLRTDIYYVILELVRGHNLYEDSLAYLGGRVHWLLRRVGVAESLRYLGTPVRDLGPTEARRVRIYAALILLGSVVSLSVFLAYSLPLVVSMVAQAVGSAVAGAQMHEPWAILDGVLATLALLGGQLLFAIVFVRRRMATRPQPRASNPIQPA